MSKLKDFTKEEKARMAWERGILEYKLDKNQIQMIEAISNPDEMVSTMLAARRLGKTTSLMIWAMSLCIRRPGFRVKFITTTRKSAEEITRDVNRYILRDCPEDLKPIYDRKAGFYKFNNNSEIQLVGVNGKKWDAPRGQAADLCIVDEAGFIEDLKYGIEGVLTHMVSTTKGKIVLASTPPRKKSHEFRKYVKEAEQRGALPVFTIYDNPRLTQEDIDRIANSYTDGGEDSPNFKRECLCLIDGEDDFNIVPEFTEEMKVKIVYPYEKPPIFIPYVGADIGGKDWTFILFGYHDIYSGKIVIEDELILKGHDMSTENFAKGVKDKERLYFVSKAREPIPVKKRTMDINYILQNDLWRSHGLKFDHAEKGTLDGMVLYLRGLISSEVLVIHPRCEQLIHQLDHGEWDTGYNKFEHLDNGSHCDGIAALIYFVRSINVRNRIQENEQVLSGDTFFTPQHFNNNYNNESMEWAKKLNPSMNQNSGMAGVAPTWLNMLPTYKKKT